MDEVQRELDKALELQASKDNKAGETPDVKDCSTDAVHPREEGFVDLLCVLQENQQSPMSKDKSEGDGNSPASEA